MPSPRTTRFSPVLVLGMKASSSGVALMSAAYSALTRLTAAEVSKGSTVGRARLWLHSVLSASTPTMGIG